MLHDRKVKPHRIVKAALLASLMLQTLHASNLKSRDEDDEKNSTQRPQPSSRVLSAAKVPPVVKLSPRAQASPLAKTPPASQALPVSEMLFASRIVPAAKKPPVYRVSPVSQNSPTARDSAIPTTLAAPRGLRAPRVVHIAKENDFRAPKFLREYFSYLGREDLGRMSLVCKDWKSQSQDEELWRDIQKKERLISPPSLSLSNVKLISRSDAYNYYILEKVNGYGPVQLMWRDRHGIQAQEIHAVEAGSRWRPELSVSHQYRVTTTRYNETRIVFACLVPWAVKGIRRPVLKRRKLMELVNVSLKYAESSADSGVSPVHWMDEITGLEWDVIDVKKYSEYYCAEDKVVPSVMSVKGEELPDPSWCPIEMGDTYPLMFPLKIKYNIVGERRIRASLTLKMMVDLTDLLYYGWRQEEMQGLYQNLPVQQRY